MKHNSRIEQLVEKFLDGHTSNAEEQELYTWFRTNDVPEDWGDLKRMFAWYEAGMPEIHTCEESIPKAMPLRRLLKWGVGVAAVVAIAFGVILREDSQPIHQYSGSYVIKNGVKCDDVAYIESDIESLLMRAEYLEQKADELLAWADL